MESTDVEVPLKSEVGLTGTLQAEQEQARLTAILEMATDFVATATPEGRVLYCNRAFRDFLGITETELPPCFVSDFYTPASWAKVQHELIPAMRNNLEWWPLHPTGYALALSFAMEYFWLPVFIAWLVKFAVLRYGGVSFYRQTLPFFLGLILGDYTVGSIWSLIGCIFSIPTYRIYI